MASARFVLSAPKVVDLPSEGLPEVAFVGRSNVGKSSLLGALLGSPGLVRVSRTPGRTQLLNYFMWQERIALVDLPGLGYAKVSRGQRQELSTMVRRYLLERQSLSLVVLLVDGRLAQPSPYDHALCELGHQRMIPMLLVVSKIDAIAKPRREHVYATLAAELGLNREQVHPCSVRSKEGIVALRKLLLARLLVP